MECRSLLAIAWILIWTLVLCEGQVTFVVIRNKNRNTPPPPNATVKVLGKVWPGGSAPKPPVPGVMGIPATAQTHGAACSAGPTRESLTRGHYFDKDNPDLGSEYYPWTDYVKNCNVSKFLYCGDNGQCKCFPGYYWNSNSKDDPNGRCVVGYHQNCSTFIAYDFRITPICGDGMQCDPDPVNPDFSRCVCFEKIAGLVYPGLYGGVQNDAVGNRKHYCARRRPLQIGEPCSEFRGQEWRGSGPPYTLVNVTHTGCNDLPGNRSWLNVYCSFPGAQTGTPAPTNPARNFVYGARTNGTCSCTDPKLVWNPRAEGCVPRKGAPCNPVTKNLTYKGWDIIKKETIPEIQSSCGINAICQPGNATDPTNGTCECTKRAGEVYLSREGFCHENQTASNIGQGKKVGENCTANRDPCWDNEHQECVNGVCQCKKGYQVAMVNRDGDDATAPERSCRGLYGIKCDSLSTCAPNSGFECMEVPELQMINASASATQKYCVCDRESPNYLNTATGRCGAMALTPTHFGLILFVLLYLGVYFDTPDRIVK